jgi:hypothetical protein
MLVGFRRIRLCPCRNVGTREREGERGREREGEREMEGNNSNGSLGWLPEVLDYLK